MKNKIVINSSQIERLDQSIKGKLSIYDLDKLLAGNIYRIQSLIEEKGSEYLKVAINDFSFAAQSIEHVKMTKETLILLQKEIQISDSPYIQIIK